MKIKTIDDWKDFEGIKKQKVDEIIIFTFDSGKTFKCTSEHKIYIEKDIPIWANCLSVGEFVEINGIKEKIVNIEVQKGEFYVYDVLNVQDVNSYICSGLNVSNCEEFWSSNYPAISSFSSSKVVIISTPKGKFNKFYDIYTGAKNIEDIKKYEQALKDNDKNEIARLEEIFQKSNSFIAAKFSYNVVPGRDEEWAKVQRAALGEVQFTQEFACCGYDTNVHIDKLGKISIGKLYEHLSN